MPFQEILRVVRTIEHAIIDVRECAYMLLGLPARVVQREDPGSEGVRSPTRILLIVLL